MAKPETMDQALAWEKSKTRYLRKGLCDKCAAQAAWGHQEGAGGWLPLHPPCASCAPIVATFPSPTTNPAWRKVPKAPRTPNTPAPPQRCSRAPETAGTAATSRPMGPKMTALRSIRRMTGHGARTAGNG